MKSCGLLPLGGREVRTKRPGTERGSPHGRALLSSGRGPDAPSQSCPPTGNCRPSCVSSTGSGCHAELLSWRPVPRREEDKLIAFVFVILILMATSPLPQCRQASRAWRMPHYQKQGLQGQGGS